jgi:glycosyltransferase involved in cell wall biosynthesis
MKNKISKVLFIANGSMIGGGNRSLVTLCNGLADRGIESRVYVPEIGEFSDELKKQKIDYIIQPTQLYVFSKIKIIIESLKIIVGIVKYKPSIIHANGIHCYKFYGRIAKLFHIPIVCHMRHFITGENSDFLVDALPNYILYNSHYNLVKTEDDLGDRLLRKVPRTVAYNFFHQHEYCKPELRAEQRALFALTAGQLAITVIGNINPGKGHLNFIDGVALFLSEHVEYIEKIKFLIVGKDVNNSGLEQECIALVKKLGLGKSIFFKGFVADAAAVYAASDILVIPSEEEPFGRIAVEAILACKQVVAMNNSGLQEILEPLITPILCKTGCADSLAKGLEKAIEKPSNNELLEQDQATIAKLFSQDTQLSQLLEIYNNVL